MGKISAKSLFLWGAAIAVAVAIAGCGGGGSSSSSSSSTAAGGETTSAAREGSGKGAQGKSESSSGKTVPSGELSKSEFVKQTNAICKEGKKQSLGKLAAYIKQHRRSSEQLKPELVVEAVQAIFVPEVRTQIDEIRALGAPKGEEAKVESFLTAMEEGAESANGSDISSSAQFTQSFKHSAELAHEYGLDDCAYG